MTFKRYESRPITRLAYEIQEQDRIDALPDNTYHVVVEGQSVFFAAHATPMPGDFVIRQSEDDIYHCPREVFLERNVVPADEALYA